MKRDVGELFHVLLWAAAIVVTFAAFILLAARLVQATGWAGWIVILFFVFWIVFFAARSIILKRRE